MSVGVREVQHRPLDDLVVAINRYLDRAPVDTSPEGLGEELVRLRHACDLIELGFSFAEAEFADGGRF